MSKPRSWVSIAISPHGFLLVSTVVDLFFAWLPALVEQLVASRHETRVQPSRAPLPHRKVVFGLSPRGLACGGHDVVILSLVEVGLLKVAPYGDDPTRAGYLEL